MQAMPGKGSVCIASKALVTSSLTSSVAGSLKPSGMPWQFARKISVSSRAWRGDCLDTGKRFAQEALGWGWAGMSPKTTEPCTGRRWRRVPMTHASGFGGRSVLACVPMCLPRYAWRLLGGCNGVLHLASLGTHGAGTIHRCTYVEPALNASLMGELLSNRRRTSVEPALQVTRPGLLPPRGCGRLRRVAVMELNGRPVTAEALRALGLYNYGHFTSIRVEDMKARGLSLHMERLVRDSEKLFGITVDTARVRTLIRSTAEQVGSPSIVRVTVFDSSGGLEHPGRATDLDILVSVREAPAMAIISPLRVESVHYQRELPSVKHVGLLGSMYHRRAAQLKGFDDALFTDARAQISEGATWNIGFFDGTHIIWPKADVLPGVTVNLLRTVIASSGMPSIEGIVQLSQVSETWAAFATNASVGVRPIQSIDSVELLDASPVIRNLQLQYAAIPGEPL